MPRNSKANKMPAEAPLDSNASLKTLEPFLVSPAQTLREVIVCLDQNAKGIALVLDDSQRLQATITDGDIRRAILSGADLEMPLQSLLEQRTSSEGRLPTTAPLGTPDAELIRLMDERSLRHIPLLDGAGRVVDLAMLGDLVKEYELPLSAVIMAGGGGTRLRPLTDTIPKPMLPVGAKPLLELIIGQLRRAGVLHLNLTTHYKSSVITEHFGDGAGFGVNLHYVHEEQPLGTAGALKLLNHRDQPLLVMNGDILTRLDFRAMLHFHREHHADMTVAVRQHEFCIPYGVVEAEGVSIKSITEKPIFKRFVNAGIYLLNPAVCALIPGGLRFDMPDLIKQAIAEGKRVVSFPVREYWLDIGQHADYQQAQEDIKTQEWAQ